jgi:hypothetical protein
MREDPLTTALLAVAIDAQLALWDATSKLELHLGVVDNDHACDRINNTVRVFAAAGDSSKLAPDDVDHFVTRIYQ